MVIKEALRFGTSFLKDVSDSASLDASLLLEKVLGCDKLFLIKNRDEVLSEENLDLFKTCLERRKNSEPMAYILEKKEFMGLTFSVKKGVLIPRPDTETLVEYAIENCKGSVLDIGTGSGAIAVSLAKFGKDLDVSAVDISDEALDIARCNAENNSVSIKFSRLDILKEEIPGKFDAIISNPPYIRTDVLETLDSDVKDFEPTLALDGGRDGLIFYRVITEKAISSLNENGLIIFEIGFDQAREVSEILEKDFKDIKVLYDLGQNPRVVTGRKK